MRFIRTAVIITIISMLSLACLAQSPTAKQDAQKACEQWLTVIDAGKYAESYDTASSMFKAAIAQEKWVRALQSNRQPLGNVVSRTLASATYSTTLPGAPDGQYVVIQFNTSLQNKKEAVETLTMVLDKDGQWRAAGYFIK